MSGKKSLVLDPALISEHSSAKGLKIPLITEGPPHFNYGKNPGENKIPFVLIAAFSPSCPSKGQTFVIAVKVGIPRKKSHFSKKKGRGWVQPE